MIYFDQNKEAYNNKETLENWGNTCIFSCTDDIYNAFLVGQYIWSEDNELIPNPEWGNIILNEAKKDKIAKNDIARDAAIISGVTYNNILFDSDTDQKANLLGAVLQMSDKDTIEWYGMNNDSLVCTKQDLLNIGSLITQLHSFCWTRNAEIKQAISEAQTIEEVNNITIDYEV